MIPPPAANFIPSLNPSSQPDKRVKPTNPGTPVWFHGGIVCTGETYKNVVKMTFAKGLY
jgi:hypothetical protein